jgi:hypothetical protein
VLEKLLGVMLEGWLRGFCLRVLGARVPAGTQMETGETYQTCATTLANSFVARLSTPDDPHRTRQISPQPKKKSPTPQKC